MGPQRRPAGYFACVSIEPEVPLLRPAADRARRDAVPAGHDRGRVDLRGATGSTFLQVSPEAIQPLTAEAMHDIAHLLRPAHLAQLRKILDDPEASANDRFVALDLLKNVNISAGGVLPMCQDTGTAIVMGKKSEGVLTGADDGEAITRGRVRRLHEAQPALLAARAADDVRGEEHRHQPARADRDLRDGDTASEYKFLFMAKGGGSANKSFLYQETKAVLNPTRMLQFLDEKIRSLGTAACPPYHLAIVIGGTSAEFTLKTVKLASARYLDTLPTEGTPAAHGFRDLELEEEVLKLTQTRDRRAVRRQVLLPRRARDPPAAPRRLVPGRDRRVVLGRPSGARQDHRRRRVPRAARDRPGEVSARRRGTAAELGGDVVKIDLTGR